MLSGDVLGTRWRSSSRAQAAVANLLCWPLTLLELHLSSVIGVSLSGSEEPAVVTRRGFQLNTQLPYSIHPRAFPTFTSDRRISYDSVKQWFPIRSSGIHKLSTFLFPPSSLPVSPYFCTLTVCGSPSTRLDITGPDLKLLPMTNIFIITYKTIYCTDDFQFHTDNKGPQN